MNDKQGWIPLTFAEVYRRARATGAETFSPFDLQRGLNELRAWIDREVDIVQETTGWDLIPAAVQGPQARLRGRHALLEELVALERQPASGPAVLVGEGGAGKSTLAAALANRVRGWDRQVWWVSAVDLDGFCMGLAGVAQDLGASPADVKSIASGTADAPDRFWRLLDNAPRKWLLVFDNADDPWMLAATDSPTGAQDAIGWVRASQRGLVVVTSRETDSRMWSAARLFPVGDLSMADAAKVLCDLAPGAGDEAEAGVLARRLGGLPLALNLAGAYLGSRVAQHRTFTAYNHAIGVTDGTTVARVAKISLDGLARHSVPQARAVLRLASCYASTPIPTRILPMASLVEALDGLTGVGLIQKSSASITLHPVVTATNRAHLGGPEVWHTAVESLNDALKELRFDEPAHWPGYRLLGQHLLSVLDAAEQVDQEHLALLMDAAAVTARAFSRSGAGRAAAALCRTALARCGALGKEHPAVLRARHQLAWTVADEGDLAQAEAIYQDVLDTRVRVLGDSHADTLDSRHEFAWIASCLDKWAEAEQRYRDALRDRLTYQGPDEQGTLTTRHELAYAIARQGRLDEALSEFRDVLRDRRRILGDDHPQTLQTRHGLAWITAKQGRWAEAETMYRHLLDLRQTVLETDHPHVLLTVHELAWTIARQDRWSNAESLYRLALERRSRTLGEHHPDTETTRRALSELLQRRIVDAVHLA